MDDSDAEFITHQAAAANDAEQRGEHTAHVSAVAYAILEGPGTLQENAAAFRAERNRLGRTIQQLPQ